MTHADYKEKYRQAQKRLREAAPHWVTDKAAVERPVQKYVPLPNIPSQPHLKYIDHFTVKGDGTFLDNRMGAKVITSTCHLHGNGFWSEVQITADDYVRFKIFRGGWFSKMLFLLGKEPRDESGSKMEWDSIGRPGHNDKLEATVGNTYLKIDEIIAEEMASEEHRDFIKGIAKTDPENLKMIAGLKNLHDGMEDVKEAPELNGTSDQLSGKSSYTGAGTGNLILYPEAHESENSNSVGLDSKFHSELAHAIRDDNHETVQSIAEAISKDMISGSTP